MKRFSNNVASGSEKRSRRDDENQEFFPLTVLELQQQQTPDPMSVQQANCSEDGVPIWVHDQAAELEERQQHQTSSNNVMDDLARIDALVEEHIRSRGNDRQEEGDSLDRWLNTTAHGRQEDETGMSEPCQQKGIESSTMEGIQNAKKTTAADLGALLDAFDDAVVTLVAGEMRLVAHRAVLMDRSPVFAAMVAQDTLENSCGQVTIVDVEGPALRLLLSYLYNLRATQLSGLRSQQLAAVQKYVVGSLKAQILEEKSSTIGVIRKPKKTTAMELGALLDACDDAVVTLVAGETRLVAHRAVLMDRSPVFAAMFRHDTLESRSGHVNIVDVEGPVLRQLLSYMYTLQAPQLPDTLIQLLAAADKYGVDSLKAACEHQVAAQMSMQTAAAVAVLAVRYSCESLREASFVYLINHTQEVMDTRGWRDAMNSQPDDLMEVNRLLVAEFRSLPAEKKGRRFREAAEKGAVGELEALLAAGADVAGEAWTRWTALHYAAVGGHVEAVRWLLARGAPVDARTREQQTPLHCAAFWGHAAVVRLLLAASADPSVKGWEGKTPLHLAVEEGHTEIAAALLEAGADRATRNNKGETPLDLARERNDQQLLELMTRT